jgi:2-iminobutanoate/2-iminopropanoate deaminase
MTKLAWLLLATAPVLGCAATVQPPKARAPEYLTSPHAAARALPFSEAVGVGDMLYLSGQIGTLPGTDQLAPGGIGPEAEQALENIKAVLARHGSSLDDVVKCSVFLADMRDWPAFNQVYRKFFSARLPARSALGANGLALGAKVEVECLAYRPGGV